MKIENYYFGCLVAEGKEYKNDVIIFPERIKPDWWRKEGHRLLPQDLSVLWNYEPEIVVIGKGAYSAMEIPRETRELLENKGIKVIALPTKEACKIFNEYLGKGKKVVGLFHLTC